MTGGWSMYSDHSNKNTRKIHFYENDDGRSVCMQAVLSDRKVKQKFVNRDDYNPDKICKKCIVTYKFLMVTKWGLQ